MREKEELGGFLGASPTAPLSKDNFISFQLAGKSILYAIFIAIGQKIGGKLPPTLSVDNNLSLT